MTQEKSQPEYDRDFYKMVDMSSTVDVTQIAFSEDDQQRANGMYKKLESLGYSHEDILEMLRYGGYSNEV